MPIQISPIKYNQNTRFTKKGNLYQQTNIGKNIGTVVAAAPAAILTKLMTEKATKRITKISKTAAFLIGMLALGMITLGRLIGTGVDKIINTIRANKADKQN